MPPNYGEGKSNPFAGEAAPSFTEVDAAIYGPVDIPESGRVVAKPQPIDQIWPDMKQPRRAIPLAARGQWDGNPDDLAAVLAGWQEQAERAAGYAIDPFELVRNAGEGLLVDAETSPVVTEYLELLALAASIERGGLTNAITVTKQGHRYVIETGERRWLAFHLLSTYVEVEKYARIPAVVKDRADVWRQAEENAARRPLNAIGIARQLALLVMDMYPNEDFGVFDEIVLPGECDRVYYAQVANGQTWQVKRGMGQAVLTATGLKSKGQVNHYRRLLSIPDEMWSLADMGNWTEFRIREMVQAQNRPPETDVRSTTVDLSGAGTGEMTPPLAPPHSDREGDADGSLTDTPLRVPTDYPPTPDEAEQEELFAAAAESEARQAVAGRAEHHHAGVFLQAIGEANEYTVQDPALEATVVSLLQLSPGAIRQIVTAYGGAETYQETINQYTQRLWDFIEKRLGELAALIEELQELGEDKSEEESDA